MKKILAAAVLFQLYMVLSLPSGLSAESLLAARSIVKGAVPYRDFFLHVGPLPAYFFAALFAIPTYAWCSLVFIVFNLLTARALYLIALDHFSPLEAELCAVLFLFVLPFFRGNQMYVETMMATFGLWGLYFYRVGNWWAAWTLFTLAVLTKLTGFFFPLAAVAGSYL